MEHLEANKIIAEFMGYAKEHRVGGLRFLINGYWTLPARMHYHTSWDWLMPVVEKIEAMGYVFEIWHNKAECFKPFQAQDATEYEAPTKLEAVYTAVVEFIKWHNTQTKVV